MRLKSLAVPVVVLMFLFIPAQAVARAPTSGAVPRAHASIPCPPFGAAKLACTIADKGSKLFLG